MKIPTPKYTNYTYNGEPVINCDKTVDIPYDYDGYIGVPITCFDKFEFGGLVPGVQILACEVDRTSGGGKLLQTCRTADKQEQNSSIGEKDICQTDSGNIRIRFYRLVNPPQQPYINDKRVYYRLILEFIAEEWKD